MEEQRLKMFADGLLRIMFELGRNGVIRGWGKLCKEELNNSHTSLNITKNNNRRRMN
jgi:hypothetical protein